MEYPEDRRASIPRFFDKFENHGTVVRVETRRWFVQKKDGISVCKSARNIHALLFATGKGDR